MKKKTLLLVLSLGLALGVLTGCGNAAGKEATAEEAAAQKTESVETTEAADEAASEKAASEEKEEVIMVPSQKADGSENLKGSGLEDFIVSYSNAISTVLAKTWDVEGEGSTYTFDLEGNGVFTSAQGEESTFTYACGFGSENEMLLYIVMDEGGAKEKYEIQHEKAGFNIQLKGIEEEVNHNLLPADVTILEGDVLEGLMETWQDENGNAYTFSADGAFLIKGKKGNDSEGSFGVTENKESGIRTISIFVPGGTLQYEYELLEDGTKLQLYNRPSETYYYWTK